MNLSAKANLSGDCVDANTKLNKHNLISLDSSLRLYKIWGHFILASNTFINTLYVTKTVKPFIMPPFNQVKDILQLRKFHKRQIQNEKIAAC